jgi:hypothetical protein
MIGQAVPLPLMLQNRVDPRGHIIRTPERGAWMGNRGLLHNEHQEVVRTWKLKAWLICLLEFKGRARKVMSPNLYTELFFLDEATAFAAGHRPCFECRREAAVRFRTAWVRGNPNYGFAENVAIGEIDAILHQERMDSKGEKRKFRALLSELPTGTFVLYEGKPYLVSYKSLFLWSPSGYASSLNLSADTELEVLTPRSTVAAFRQGYMPQVAHTGANEPG